MLCTSILALVAISGDAHRVDNKRMEVTKADFGASCTDLQSMFHTHVTHIAELQAAHQEEDISTTLRARYSMRAFRIIRTLRRARTCSWVTDSDSEDIKQVQALAQAFLASNPCVPAARAELEAGANPETDEIEVESLNRAMHILISEDCEAPPESSAEPDAPPSEEELLSMVRMAEEDGDDRVEELLQEGESTSGSFVQSDAGFLRSFMRRLGTFFVALLMVLACVSGAAAIVALIVFAVTNIFFYQLSGCVPGQRCGELFVAAWTLLGAGGGAFFGLPGCVSYVYRSLTPS